MTEDVDLLRKLGKTIKSTRKARGLTQENVAELCGFDPTYISLLETGKRNPPFLTLCMIARVLNCTLAQLLSD
jgi:transcriptional regulator with XRE-family HTH domain